MNVCVMKVLQEVGTDDLFLEIIVKVVIARSCLLKIEGCAVHYRSINTLALFLFSVCYHVSRYFRLKLI